MTKITNPHVIGINTYATEVRPEDWFTTISTIVDTKGMNVPRNFTIPVMYSIQVEMIDIDKLLDHYTDPENVRNREAVVDVYQKCEARNADWTKYISLVEFLNVWSLKKEVYSLDDLHTRQFIEDHDG